MTCCIVGLLLLALVSRVRRAVGLAPDDSDAARSLFAPVAQRPAPGQAAVAPCPMPVDCRPGGAAVFRYAASAFLVCLTVVPVLAWTGVIENTGSTPIWLARGACYLSLVALAVMLSRGSFWGDRRGPGWLLIVAGAVIFETGVLDMHVFRIIEVEDLRGDMVFHNVGPALALAGGLVLLYGAAGRRRISRRSSRSTETNARPSSSAVMVSSTPPATT